MTVRTRSSRHASAPLVPYSPWRAGPPEHTHKLAHDYPPFALSPQPPQHSRRTPWHLAHPPPLCPEPSPPQQTRPPCQVACLAAAVVAIGAGVLDVLAHAEEANAHVAWVLAGAATALTVPVTIDSVVGQLQNYRCARAQRYALRMLWLPLVYGANSWLALRYRGAAVYLESARDAYEAWAVYALYGYLCAYLEGLPGGGPPGSLVRCRLVATAPEQPHLPPLSLCFPPWAMASGSFVERTRAGVLQYCVVQVPPGF